MDMSDAITLSPELSGYVRSVSVRESDILRRLREETAARPDSSMLTSPEQAHFLAWLARAIGARRCLEIGVFTGYTSLVLAQALPDDGRLTACDVSDEFTAIASRYWREAGVEHKIDLRLGPALGTLDALLRGGHAGGFDFAYIDADKVSYTDYYERTLSLLRPGGVIAADNVLWGGEVIASSPDDPDVTAIRAFNERLRDDDRVFLSLLAIRDGLTLACKR
jgi:predicted O-methyltransferase YrrM